MKTRYHEGIFYPEDKEKLSLLTEVEKKDAVAKALLVPHQALEKCHCLISEALSYAGNPERVIIFSPLHSPRLERDKDECFFEGDLLPSSKMVLLGLKSAEYYAEEEPAAELIVPFLEANLPEARWSVIYTDIRNAKESKKLSSFIEKLNDGKTLFIISSNLSERTKTAEETRKWKGFALEALEKGEFLLDKQNKNQVHLCGAGVIDALSRVIGGKWTMVKDEEDDTITAHASFVRM